MKLNYKDCFQYCFGLPMQDSHVPGDALWG